VSTDTGLPLRVLTCNPEQADRLVLETLNRARRDPPKEGTSLRTRLFAIMHELHSRELTRPNLEAAAPDVEVPSAIMSAVPDAAIECEAGATSILEHLALLPVEHREVLVLVVVEQLGYAEIATMLGVPVGTVWARLNCAREAMRW
jgi:RNA polymerase sigma-70 factor (ECF subfamily)